MDISEIRYLNTQEESLICRLIEEAEHLYLLPLYPFSDLGVEASDAACPPGHTDHKYSTSWFAVPAHRSGHTPCLQPFLAAQDVIYSNETYDCWPQTAAIPSAHRQFHTDIIHRQGEGGKYIQLGIQLYVQVKYLLMKLTLLAVRSTQLTEPPAAINTAWEQTALQNKP